jgi:hypothetical protein
VVGDVERVLFGPWAAREAVGMQEGGHGFVIMRRGAGANAALMAVFRF